MAESWIQLPPDSSGKKSRTIEETVGAELVHTAVVQHRTLPTFYAHGVNIAPAVNAHMIAILNRNTAKVIRLWRVNVYVSAETVVTGVLLKMQALRVTATVALTGGVAVTPVQADTNDTLPGSIDVMTKPTSTLTGAGVIKTFMMSADEAVVSTLDADAEAAQEMPRDSFPLILAPFPFAKPITLRTNGTTHQGFSIQNLVGTVGNVGLELLFTVSDE